LLIGVLAGGVAAICMAFGVIWFVNRDTGEKGAPVASNSNSEKPKPSRLDAPETPTTPAGETTSAAETKKTADKPNSTDSVKTADKPAEGDQPNGADKPKGGEKPKPTSDQWVFGSRKPPATLPVAMPDDVLKQVERSAVLIKVRSSHGGGDGSGWFAEPGIVVTNSHVVGMLSPAEPPPQSIRVVLYAGMKDEVEYSGKLLGLDRENDLAVIQVKGHNLPEPMPVAPSAEVVETQKLHVVGFPHGSFFAERLSTERDKIVTTLKVRNTYATGRFRHKDGGVKYIQIEGGADPGNSGGAVVDTAGFVRSI